MFTEHVLNIQKQTAVSWVLENPILFYTVWTPLIYSNVQSFTQFRLYFSFNGRLRRTFTKIMLENGHYVLRAGRQAGRQTDRQTHTDTHTHTHTHTHTQRIQWRLLLKYPSNKNKFPCTMIASWAPGRWSSKNVHVFIINFGLIFPGEKKNHCPPPRTLPQKKLLLNTVRRRKLQKIYLHNVTVEGLALLSPMLPGFKLP
jgi:hypothetical protein